MKHFPKRSLFQAIGLLFLVGGMIPLMQWISHQMSVQWAEQSSNLELALGALLFSFGLALLVAWRWTRKFLRYLVIGLLLALVIVFLLFTTGVFTWRAIHAAGSLLISSAILFAFFVQGIRYLTTGRGDAVASTES